MREVNVGLEAVMNTYFEYVGCKKCSLCFNRRSKDVLPGFGSASADILIITDKPTMEDDANGELLSDASGRFLLNVLEMVWYEDDMVMDSFRDLRTEDYFISVRDYLSKHIFFTAVTACPTEDGVNATKKQSETCRERVNKLIYQIDPKIVVCLGSEAGKYILGKGEAQKTRGMIKDFSIPSLYSSRSVRYAGMVTYHPKHVLNSGDMNLIEQERGMTYDIMQDLKKALNLIKIHKELHI